MGIITVRESIKDLPLQKRFQLMENIRIQRGLKTGLERKVATNNLTGVIITTITWEDTRQGGSYWSKVHSDCYRIDGLNERRSVS